MRSLNPWSVFPPNLEAPVARSLSIQFILQTLIDAFALTNELKSHTDYTGLENFYLFSLENPFAQKGGHLDKLCFYSEILLQTSQVKDSELIALMEKMRTSILSRKPQLMLCKRQPKKLILEEMMQLMLHLSTELFHLLKSFFTALVPFLKEARSDENVLVYLLESKEKLNENLGDHCIEDVLQSLFPAGHDQLRAVIHEGYTRRGFDTFLSSVQPLIDSIHWETPCHSQNTH
jgi:hypothetical protein